MSAHVLYVAAAYSVALAGIASLVLTLFLDGLSKKKRLAQLELSRPSRQNRVG